MLKKIEAAFAEMDKEVLEKQKAWAVGRCAAMRAAKSEMGREINYQNLFDISGGKTWYNVFNGRSMDMIVEFVEKNCKAIADKRNATIVAKLKKQGISEIGAFEFGRTSEGFQGVFVFEGFRAEIRTILAGGYNIQCLHQRTLVFVNGRKA